MNWIHQPWMIHVWYGLAIVATLVGSMIYSYKITKKR
jgi:hypothetical protein